MTNDDWSILRVIYDSVCCLVFTNGTSQKWSNHLNLNSMYSSIYYILNVYIYILKFICYPIKANYVWLFYSFLCFRDPLHTQVAPVYATSWLREAFKRHCHPRRMASSPCGCVARVNSARPRPTWRLSGSVRGWRSEEKRHGKTIWFRQNTIKPSTYGISEE